MATSDNNNQDVEPVLVQIFGDCINKRFPLNGPVVQIGKAVNSDVRVNGASVSQKHCILKKEPEGWTLKNCGSQFGTFKNGQRLKRNETVPLLFGDVIFLGPPSDFPTAFCFEGVDKTEEIWAKTQSLDQDEILLSCAVQSSIDSQFNKDIDWVPTASHQIYNVASSSKNGEFNEEQNSVKVLKPKNTSAVASSSMLQSSEHRGHDRCCKLTVNNQKEVEDLKSKLAVLSEQIKKLEKSKSDLVKENEVACEKNKLLDLQLMEQSKVIDDMLMNEQTMKTEFKNQIMGRLEEDLVCNICAELLIKPTVLDCSHTFCEFCIRQWEKEKRQCPMCRKNIHGETRVLALDNFIDKTLEALSPEQKKTRQQLILDRESKQIPNSTPPAKRRRALPVPRHTISAPFGNPVPPPFLAPFANNTPPIFAVNRSSAFSDPWNFPPFSSWF